MKRNVSILILVAIAVALFGCKAVSILPSGTYTEDSFGTVFTHVFSSTSWTISSSFGDSSFTVISTNTSDSYIIYQNGANNSFNPEKYSRVDFAVDSDDDLYYCQIAYDKASADEAEAVDTADSSDLTSSGTGCSGFSWSKLTPVE